LNDRVLNAEELCDARVHVGIIGLMPVGCADGFGRPSRINDPRRTRPS
jgi:hypothetical protein